MLGYVRLMTGRSVLLQPFTPAALAHLRSWLERPQVETLQPGPRHLDILENLAASADQFAAVTSRSLPVSTS